MTVTRREFNLAVAKYWQLKQEQSERAKNQDRTSPGTTSSTRAGNYFTGVAELIGKFFLDVGYPRASVQFRQDHGLEVLGYYRPQKQWDVMVTSGNTLVAAFDLKALSGPSFGRNYNSRFHEALGNAIDVNRAHLEELYPGEKPWIGYFFIMEEHKNPRPTGRPGKGPELPLVPSLKRTSYQDSYAIFCNRLLDERVYDTVCYVTSAQENDAPKEPVESLNWARFAASVNSRISYLKELGHPG
ncbi:PaeR7I family type II restriction endonuclease [Nocardiopsis metallicus]|uniref:Uncharacterized protein n=1 Tax=Nocardiopsis metallicus TaxID=179819 RepID=A0A840WG79_9ACTN|nr:PaeR7I family type II restriction endonuclease [Nocardiopsis metallicus]MBB5495242.1 hypothetical protein [Nocardiopsis metallicus]